jgi:PEP-CTERM motif
MLKCGRTTAASTVQIIDRYITFDFSNLGGANLVEFRAFNENEDFLVLNFSASVPEPSTWAMMLIGFAELDFMGYRRTKKSAAV